ncbi:MAG: GlsB/YeaQ/YmgE family stress response membrane protein [Deltaproteobacteria bacterium]|nr:GlsB/YeaQ/YmgE family stress response membrane protein [Deltaproteobacteria bacterium]
MNITASQIIVWLIVGALAGSLTGLVVKGTKKGFGPIANLAIGLIGALIGGTIVRAFNIDLGLGALAISFQDLLSAFLGSLVFLGLVWLIHKKMG